MKEFPRKFLSLRDKNATHRRSTSVPPGPKDKARPLSTEALRAIFKKDVPKTTLKSDDEQIEADPSKVEEVQRRLEIAHIDVTVDFIKDIMTTNIADGDADKTVEFIVVERESASGIIAPYDPSVHMLGAENRGNVTCYLDALLFAMFSKLDAFECMLKIDFPANDARAKLLTLLRIWVNLLRTGKLIRTDFTKLMQEALADCGWSDAKLLEQQDTSEAFAFLTETLQLPLLSLQVDLFHQGKKDKDDHKVVFERLLNLAVPPDPEGRGLNLEDCLEEYFNAKVDVLRDHEEARKGSIDDKTPQLATPMSRQNTLRLLEAEKENDSVLPASAIDLPALQDQSYESLNRSPSRASASLSTDCVGSLDGTRIGDEGTKEQGPSRQQRLRTRSASVIQRVVVDENGHPTDTEEGAMAKRAKRKGSNIVKALTIPAWQFFRLIPWHALTPNEPRSDSEVAMNFDQKPIVGICLKRYAMTSAGKPQRYNTFIDIPDSLRLPHFMLAGGPNLVEELDGLSTEYKLVLQSVVCHRGVSLQSGHYIAFARVAPKLLVGNRRHDFDPPPDYEEAQWVKFDDLDTENRVAYVDNIKQALKAEMPYLLFYQVVPMFDVPRPSTDDGQAEPPSYNDSRQSLELGNETASYSFGGLNGHHRDELQRLDMTPRSKPPSIRLSADLDWSAGSNSLRVPSHTGSTPMGSRRESIEIIESPAVTPGATSPALTPVDESTQSRLSRAASRFTLGRQSRSQSQTGEGRLNFSIGRLGGLMRSSREPLAEPSSTHGLPLSTSTSTGPLSETSSKTSESPAEGEKQQSLTPQGGGKEKHRHRGTKAKEQEKSEKQKAPPDGDQPERECIVM